eukprot:4936522-Lingulodinium_polyedra.AAC.1
MVAPCVRASRGTVGVFQVVGLGRCGDGDVLADTLIATRDYAYAPVSGCLFATPSCGCAGR